MKFSYIFAEKTDFRLLKNVILNECVSLNFRFIIRSLHIGRSDVFIRIVCAILMSVCVSVLQFCI